MRKQRAIWIAVLFACGCEAEPTAHRETPIPVAPAAPVSRSTVGSDEPITGTTQPTEKRLAGVTLAVPAGWEERPVTGDVLLAEYRLSGSAGPARLTMSSMRGGVEANIEMWQTQVTRGPGDPAPTRTAIPIDGAESIILELHGTFQDRFSKGDSKSGWCLLGAAIPTGSDAMFFIKLTGPRETVLAHRDEFHELVKSVRRDF
jgi:hypothetical protein